MLTITVPGSTANLGPGFDSIGMALGCTLKLTAVLSDQWLFEGESSEVAGLPEGKENLIYQSAARAAAAFDSEMPPCHVKVWSDIPVARGLGSSAAAVVAGIELANELCSLELSNIEKTRIASLIEEHPDNVGASVYGGLVIGLHQEEETEIIHVPSVTVDTVAIIPAYKVYTKDARNVLPDQLPYRKAVEASAVSNLLTGAIMSGNWELAGRIMKKDLLHQPYRHVLIPEYREALEVIEETGAYGAAISGAGPAVLCFAASGEGEQLELLLAEKFPACQVKQFSIPKEGSTVHYSEKMVSAAQKDRSI